MQRTFGNVTDEEIKSAEEIVAIDLSNTDFSVVVWTDEVFPSESNPSSVTVTMPPVLMVEIDSSSEEQLRDLKGRIKRVKKST